MSARPYADDAAGYLAAGWRGVLPVGTRPRLKSEPPKGYTGHDGAWPSADQVDAWTRDHPTSNIALRLPRGVVGIDVDAYDGKLGADTMAVAAAAHGKLPPTWNSTSREDGVSGIRLFRVPEADEYGGKLVHPERREQSHVELIQYHHRYAVVAPSVHPEGREYRWIAPDGTPGDIPRPVDLPELPDGWLAHLAGTCACFASLVFVAPTTGDAVADRLAEARAAIRGGTGSRHEGVAPPVLALVGFARRGSREAADALEAIHVEYVAAVTSPGPGRVESPASAEREWHRMTAEGKAATAGMGEPPWEERPSPPRGEPRPAADPAAWPQPEDRGHAVLSPLGDVEYVGDLARPGRIITWAAEEGAGKSYTVDGELGIRVAVAGGSLAGTWPILQCGPVLVLSEMHSDDDYAREASILEALELERSALSGRYYRLPLMTAAGGPPVLTVPAWRDWVTGWLRDHGALLLIVDTATGATQVDPWGQAIQAVYRDLRAMLEAYPRLAIVLVLHLKKPQGRGDRRISDVLGEWGRWCDVVVLQEADGATRTKLATHKRVRHQRRIVATRASGLLVDPQDLTVSAGKATKVPQTEVLARVAERPGLTFVELGELLRVSKDTAGNYVRAAEQAGLLVTIPRGPKRAIHVYVPSAVSDATAEPPNTAEGTAFGGASAVPSAVGGEGPPNAEPTYKGSAVLRSSVGTAGPVGDGTDSAGLHQQIWGARDDGITTARGVDESLRPTDAVLEAGDEQGEGITVLELPPLRVVPPEPPDLFAAPARPPCFGDRALYVAHQLEHYAVESDTPGCRACEAAEVSA